MAKAKTAWFCTDCGGESVRWMGKCPHCGAYNTMVEEKIPQATAATAKPGRVQTAAAKARPLPEVAIDQLQRMQTGLNELDTVLGGGLAPGSSVLLGGEPGIGKSTLLLQAAAGMARYGKVLYVTGEESAAQVRQRAERLLAVNENIYLLSQTEIQAALDEARALQPVLLIIDSVQAVFNSELDSAPGSVSQVRAIAAAAIGCARESGAAVLLIGHVTKEGMLAGPRVLEHMVDAVLYFEGERAGAFRLLRAVKNRYGSTNEIGVFEMSGEGLLPLDSPSAYFLSERRGQTAGSAVSCVMQGSRPLLIEVQALVSQSSFGNPRRLAQGFDQSRLLILLAVLERRLGLPLTNKDVYLNVAGGLRTDDPAVDLAAAAAIVSSLKDRPLAEGLLLLGELGLLGELRSVTQEERRAREAANFGFTTLLHAARPEVSVQRPANLPLRALSAEDLPSALAILGM